jgi:hypothetical protein
VRQTAATLLARGGLVTQLAPRRKLCEEETQ